MPVELSSVPNFDNLPHDGSVFGASDKLGTLNFLTAGIKRAAAAEIQHGVSISLNWPLNAMRHLPATPRKPTVHTPLPWPDPLVWDDQLTFNTQSSSQWDSLVHVHSTSTSKAYNGGVASVSALSVEETADNPLPTLDHWHAAGGVVARGVLVDYVAYMAHLGRQYHPCDAIGITVDEVEACAAHQGVEFKEGDVLLVHTGFTEKIARLDEADIARLSKGTGAGLESSVAMARWIWDRRFAAVAADNMALETLPGVTESGELIGGTDALVLHQYLLSKFGMSIGELWDLSALAEYCAKNKRHSFMLTSVPLNHPGLVGSPPNALAIF